MSMTLQQRFAKALEGRGEKRVKTTAKYWVYSLTGSTIDGHAVFLYLGKSGSLRIGRTISESHPVAASGKQRLLAEIA